MFELHREINEAVMKYIFSPSIIYNLYLILNDICDHKCSRRHNIRLDKNLNAYLYQNLSYNSNGNSVHASIMCILL